jgi:hypothetical protein
MTYGSSGRVDSWWMTVVGMGGSGTIPEGFPVSGQILQGNKTWTLLKKSEKKMFQDFFSKKFLKKKFKIFSGKILDNILQKNSQKKFEKL